MCCGRCCLDMTTVVLICEPVHREGGQLFCPAHIAFGNEENLEDCFGVELEHFIWLAKLKGSLSNGGLNGEG